MSLVINNNLMAYGAGNNLNAHYANMDKSVQRLSSGLRVMGASDDAAGLAIREIMRSEITTLQQGIRNANDGVSLLQTADGALGVVDQKLIRMKELAEQAATGTYDEIQRGIIDDEYQAMADEVTRIAEATDFNGIKLLDGSLSGVHDGSTLDASGAVRIHFGTGNDSTEDYYDIEIAETTASALGVGKTAGMPTIDETVGYFQASQIDRTGGWGTDTTNILKENGEFIGVAAVIDAFAADAAGVADNATESLIEAAVMADAYALHITGEGNSEDTPEDFMVLLSETLGIDREFLGEYTPTTAPGQYLDYTLAANWNDSVSGMAIPPEDATLRDGTTDFRPFEGMMEEAVSLSRADTQPGHSIRTQENAQKALDALTNAIVEKDRVRAHIGALQNRLAATMENLTVQRQNIQAAESRISDVNVTTEMTEFVRNQTLTQAAVGMLSQANSIPQMAQQLIG